MGDGAEFCCWERRIVCDERGAKQTKKVMGVHPSSSVSLETKIISKCLPSFWGIRVFRVTRVLRVIAVIQLVGLLRFM